MLAMRDTLPVEPNFRIAAMLSAALLLGAAASAECAPVEQRELAQVLARKPDLAKGAALYETCAACHGLRGEGVSDGSVPALAGQPYMVIAKQIVDFRAQRRSDPRMAHFTDTRHLAFSQPIADVAAYISRLPPIVGKPQTDREGHAAASMVYARKCERCHGSSAEGNEDTLTPRLAGQHVEYVLKQLQDAGSGVRPAMRETHSAFARELSDVQLADIAAFVASLRPAK